MKNAGSSGKPKQAPNNIRGNYENELQSFEDELEHQSQEVMVDEEHDQNFQDTIYESRDEMKNKANKAKYAPDLAKSNLGTF